MFSNGTVGSHFYTIDQEECAYVKSRLDWGWNYEGDAFYVIKPTGGTCPSGTAPVYRAYNNGMGGAPNHRYVASQAEVDTMVSQGWSNENLVMCSPSTEQVASEQLATSLNQTFSDASIDASVTALTQSGLTVVSDDGAVALSGATTSPTAKSLSFSSTAQGLSLLRFQARGMAQEIANRDGLSGAGIDRMTLPIPLPNVNKSITVSMMIAVYVKTANTNGARVARGLMGDIDTAKHAEYVYPSLVIMSFLQEVAVPLLAEMEAANGPAAAALSIRQLLAAPVITVASFSGDPCGAINEFLDDLPATVTHAVSSVSPASSGFLSTLISATAIVAGVATDLAVDAARGLIRHAPGVDAVRSGMTALHAAADVKAMLTQWKVEVSGAPGDLHKIPGSPTSGTFTVTLSNGGTVAPSWPPVVQSCAELLDIPLPDFNNPSATVVWQKVAGFNVLAIEASRENALANSTAKFTFNTATESQEIHDNPAAEKTTGPATVSATVSLPGLESLLSALSPGGSGGVGGVVSAGVSGAATPVAQELGTAKMGTVPVEYHTSSPASADLSGYISLRAYSCDGVNGVWTGTFTEDSPMSGAWTATATWQFDGNNTAVVSYSRTTAEDCMVNTETRTWSLVLSGLPDSPVIDGEINAAQSSYYFEVDGSACDPPDEGAGSIPNQHMGIAPIVIGPCAECTTSAAP